MFKKIIVSAAMILMVASYSTASKDVNPSYVSAAQYAAYDCEQISLELARISTQANALGGKLDKNRSNDNLTATAGVILFWPALFFLGGTKEQEAQFAKLKGEYLALEQAAVLKRCGLSSKNTSSEK